MVETKKRITQKLRNEKRNKEVLFSCQMSEVNFQSLTLVF